MQNGNFFLVDSAILPPVFHGVIYAKELLASGEAQNTSKAIKMAGISRSAFYKYKDHIFRYESKDGNIIKLVAVLNDRAGVFSALTASLYNNGANIITINQEMPVNGTANVSLTVRTDNFGISVNELINRLKSVEGVISIKSI